MKSLSEYQALNDENRFQCFIDTLSKTNRTADYYVNWDKVEQNISTHELSLNTLNYLIGKDNIYQEATKLFTEQPNLIKTIPLLIACRDTKLDILMLEDIHKMDFYSLDFNSVDTENIDAYVKFCDESGLLNFIQSSVTRTLVDYVLGVEVGLDSNARKNRSGTVMENLLNRYISTISKALGLEYKSQATATYIQKTWGIEVPVDKAARHFDEAVFNPKTNELWIFETNYYGGGGSKLKAVAGEFSSLDTLIKSSSEKIKFVWVTDGQGWLTAKAPMLEAFGQIDYIFNLSMLQQGFLTSLFQMEFTR